MALPPSIGALLGPAAPDPFFVADLRRTLASFDENRLRLLCDANGVSDDDGAVEALVLAAIGGDREQRYAVLESGDAGVAVFDKIFEDRASASAFAENARAEGRRGQKVGESALEVLTKGEVAARAAQRAVLVDFAERELSRRSALEPSAGLDLGAAGPEALRAELDRLGVDVDAGADRYGLAAVLAHVRRTRVPRGITVEISKESDGEDERRGRLGVAPRFDGGVGISVRAAGGGLVDGAAELRDALRGASRVVIEENDRDGAAAPGETAVDPVGWVLAACAGARTVAWASAAAVTAERARGILDGAPHLALSVAILDVDPLDGGAADLFAARLGRLVALNGAAVARPLS